MQMLTATLLLSSFQRFSHGVLSRAGWTALILAVTLVAATQVAAQHSPPIPAKPRASETAPARAKAVPSPALGLVLSEMSSDELMVRKIRAGVRVERAIGVAAVSGLQVGDVITQLNGKPVTSIDHFWQLAEIANYAFELAYVRGDEARTLSIQAN